MTQPQQQADAEAVVIEDNVVNWALGVAKAVDDKLTVEGLLADGAAQNA